MDVLCGVSQAHTLLENLLSVIIHIQIKKFLFRKEIYKEHQNILTPVLNQD